MFHQRPIIICRIVPIHIIHAGNITMTKIGINPLDIAPVQLVGIGSRVEGIPQQLRFFRVKYAYGNLLVVIHHLMAMLKHLIVVKFGRPTIGITQKQLIGKRFAFLHFSLRRAIVLLISCNNVTIAVDNFVVVDNSSRTRVIFYLIIITILIII